MLTVPSLFNRIVNYLRGSASSAQVLRSSVRTLRKSIDNHPKMAAAPEFIPGTVHLVDLEGTMHSRHAAGGKSDIVLVPAPSNHPDDPLNWTPRRKLLSLTCLCM